MTENDTTAGLSSVEAFEYVRSEKRRHMLWYLEKVHRVELRALAEFVAATRLQKPLDDISDAERKREYVSLYQTHLPKLEEEFGIVSYDAETGTVSRADPDAVSLLNATAELVGTLDEGASWNWAKLLSNFRSRCVIDALRDDEPLELKELGRRIAAREKGKGIEEVADNEAKRVYVSLYQTHAPRLSSTEAVAFDYEGRLVSVGNADAFSDVTTVIDEVEKLVEQEEPVATRVAEGRQHPQLQFEVLDSIRAGRTDLDQFDLPDFHRHVRRLTEQGAVEVDEDAGVISAGVDHAFWRAYNWCSVAKGRERHVVAIDIGSTWVKAILGTSSGERLTEVRTHRTDAGSLLPDLEELVSVVSDGHDVDDIVVSVGGTIDKDEGTLTYLLTSDGDTLENLGIVDHLEDRFGVDVTLLNDCEAAVVGEWVFGAGEDVDTLCYLTFSSGIGAGVIDHGHLLRGEHGSSAEVGLFPIRPTSDVERHGIAGCWEAFASGEGIAEYVSLRLASEDRETVLTQTECTAEAFFEAVEGGDEVAQAYLDEIGRLSAAGLGTVVQAYNPGKITVGGSVAIHNWDVLWDAIERYRDSYVFLDVAEPRVTPLGEHVELYGCLGYESFERAG